MKKDASIQKRSQETEGLKAFKLRFFKFIYIDPYTGYNLNFDNYCNYYFYTCANYHVDENIVDNDDENENVICENTNEL